MVTGRTFADVYDELLKKVLEIGATVSPRGMETKELLQETFCVLDPTKSLVYIPGRNFSLCHAILESMLIFTTDNSVKVAGHFNEKIKEFSDDGDTLYGAYGCRISKHIEKVIEKLQNEPDTRQALLTIHEVKDSFKETKDPPCTVTLQFTIREGKLNMHVYMRSNDLIWGTPYDVFVFTNMQQVIANTLHVGLGSYYHTATSLHLYSNYYELAEKSAGHCFALTHANYNDYYEWKQIAKVYFTFIHKNTRKSAENAYAFSTVSKDLQVLLMEDMYRGTSRKLNAIVDSTKYYEEYASKVNFARLFTRRWWKWMQQMKV